MAGLASVTLTLLNHVELIYFTLAGEERLAVNKFAHDAPNGPTIDTLVVTRRPAMMKHERGCVQFDSWQHSRATHNCNRRVRKGLREDLREASRFLHLKVEKKVVACALPVAECTVLTPVVTQVPCTIGWRHNRSASDPEVALCGRNRNHTASKCGRDSLEGSPV
jgi:hypothetical protein